MTRQHYETLQEVFDDAYCGLAAQGFVKSTQKLFAIGSDEYLHASCAYRGVDGRRCAIGHCIPDDLYTGKMEGASVGTSASGFIEAFEVFARLFGLISINDIRRLQDMHDGASSPGSMKDRLADFAQEHGLTIPSIEGAA
ncbi:hypothetical protein [Aureimonas pseudogalii]|uniref:Uncharacterized protein n=1 Tax=Aureimonas pseudogalii TaxID=1744844 RepID=A0A7W6EG23_9HYPH|nr:hypothetical protein [Aureimonas pseudogalii]MBB3997244.1 hypothetical protein [Aureimonas pseudogalii]